MRPCDAARTKTCTHAGYEEPHADRPGGVFYPGEVEYIREQQRRVSGIDVEDATWDKLRALADEYKLAAELELT